MSTKNWQFFDLWLGNPVRKPVWKHNRNLFMKMDRHSMFSYLISETYVFMFSVESILQSFCCVSLLVSLHTSRILLFFIVN